MAYDADLVRTGPGRILIAPVGGVVLPTTFDDGTLPGGSGTDDTDWTEIGFTTGGSSLSLTQDRIPVRVAERLREIRNQAGPSSLVFSFTMAEISPTNLARVIAGGVTTAASGTTPNGLVVGSGTTAFSFPKTTGSQRYTVAWQSDDKRELLVLSRCFVTAAGDLTNGPVDSGDPRALPIECAVEDAGTGVEDAYWLFDSTLLA